MKHSDALFHQHEPKEMFDVVNEHVFPFLRTLGGDGSTFTKHMTPRDE